MSQSPMPDQGQAQGQATQAPVPKNVQQPVSNTPQGPQPTPAMRQLQIDMQRLTQQYQALGGNNGNPQQLQPILQSMAQLKQQYGALSQQQMAQFRQQQQQLQQQQLQQQQLQQQQVQRQVQQQAQQQQQTQQQQNAQQQQQHAQQTQNQLQAQAIAASTKQQAPLQQSSLPISQATAGTGRPLGAGTNAQAANGIPAQLDAIFGQPPGPGATPQMLQQWQEQQQRVQQLLRTMSELKLRIQGLKEEIQNPQLPPEQRQAKQQAITEHISHFQRYQQVLANAGRTVRAQQAGLQQAANQAAAAQQAAGQQVSSAQAPGQQTPVQAPTTQTNLSQPVATSSSVPVIPSGAAIAAAATAVKPSPAPTQGPPSGAASATNSPGIARPNSTTLNQPSGTQQPATPLTARPVVPQQVAPGRPTLNNGQVGPPSMTGPALAKPPATLPFDTSIRVLGKRDLAQLLSSIDPSEKLDADVEDVLLDVADEFIESVVNFSCRLAKHRKTDILGLEDVKLTLDKEWNIRVMGFADEKIETRRRTAKEGNKDHKAKMTAVSTAKSLQ